MHTEKAELVETVASEAGPGNVADGGAVDSADPVAPPANWRNWTRDLSRPAGYFVLSRFGVLFAALVGKWIFPRLNVPFVLGSGWDGGWYLRIAQHGYPSHLVNEYGSGSRWAFFPAFPAAIRLVASTTGLSFTHAAIVASAVCGLASVIAVWLMVSEVFGRQVADRTTLLYVFFPSAYVLSMAYTEGLFVAAACFCLYALSRRWWITAGVLASVASLSRNIGVVLVVCVAVAVVPELVRGRAGGAPSCPCSSHQSVSCPG